MKDISIFLLNSLIEDTVAVEPSTLGATDSPFNKVVEKIYGNKPTNKFFDPLLDKIEKKYNIPYRNLQFPLANETPFPIPRRYDSDEKIKTSMFGNVKGQPFFPMYNKTVSGPIPRGTSREELNKIYPSIPISKGNQ